MWIICLLYFIERIMPVYLNRGTLYIVLSRGVVAASHWVVLS